MITSRIHAAKIILDSDNPEKTDLVSGRFLSNWKPGLSHAIALGVFVMLTGVATFGWFRGDLSCGCFGALDISPAITAAMDVVIVVTLATTLSTISIRDEVRTFGVMPWRVLIFVSLFFVGIFIRQSHAERSKAIRIPTTVVVPPGAVGSDVEFTVLMTNSGPVPVSVVGGGTSCTCVTLTDIPSTIQPHDRLALRIRILRPKSVGRLRQRLVYYLDHPDQHFVSAAVTGLVTTAQPVEKE